ncbi:MAG: Lrp/AsnC family transcriptional regulator [Deltaproteobacteria bacterium]|jgi:DNA-binding Lrp family transcriptional regulator|nr:Lrp/AsnC family transcriptional regulator [Deltaproteobacteria bacterium]
MTQQTNQLDHIDTLILNAVQDDFPVCERPYYDLAQQLNQEHRLALDEKTLLERVNTLRDGGFLRRLGAIFNSAPLGYRSTLCAAKVPHYLLEEVAEIINQRPEVTHNYVRNDDFNVWFTFCHNRQSSLDDFLTQLRAIEGIGAIFDLPASKVYKIRAVFTITEQ